MSWDELERLVDERKAKGLPMPKLVRATLRGKVLFEDPEYSKTSPASPPSESKK